MFRFILVSAVGLSMFAVACMAVASGEFTVGAVAVEMLCAAFIFVACVVYRPLNDGESAVVVDEKGVKNGDYRVYLTDSAFCLPAIEHMVRVTRKPAQFEIRITPQDGMFTYDGCSIEAVVQLKAVVMWGDDLPRVVSHLGNNTTTTIDTATLEKFVRSTFLAVLAKEVKLSTAIELAGDNVAAAKIIFRGRVNQEMLRVCKKAGVTVELYFDEFTLVPA